MNSITLAVPDDALFRLFASHGLGPKFALARTVQMLPERLRLSIILAVHCWWVETFFLSCLRVFFRLSPLGFRQLDDNVGMEV